MTLADAGDGLEDANFVFEMADAGLLRLYSQIEWIKVPYTCICLTICLSVCLSISFYLFVYPIVLYISHCTITHPFFYSNFPFDSCFYFQEMITLKDTMRNDFRDKWTYQDHVFNNEINHAIIQTDNHYDNMRFREALRSGFYDLQVCYRVVQ